MTKKYTPKETLAQKLREPNTIFLLGGGTSVCAGLPGIFELTSLVQSKLCNVHRSTFDEITKSIADSGTEAPNIEEVLSELYNRLSAAGLADHDRERFKATFEDI